jgi:hypothetical protein
MDMDNEAGGEQGEDIGRRLEGHPIIKTRITKLLDLIENAGGDLRRADDAERRAIDELRAMGQEVLHGWGAAAGGRGSTASEQRRHGGTTGKNNFTGTAPSVK